MPVPDVHTLDAVYPYILCVCPFRSLGLCVFCTCVACVVSVYGSSVSISFVAGVHACGPVCVNIL